MDPSVDQFVTHLQNRVGEALRSVAYYTPETYEELYVRDDVQTKHETYGLHDEQADRFRAEATERNTEEWAFMDGNLGATVRVFEEAVVLHFPLDEEQGTVVAIDPTAARNLVSFVADCRRDLYD